MPRKTQGASEQALQNIAASMRPRPDAAENVVVGDQHHPATAASMRPRPDAAENRRVPAPHPPAEAASMRPRPDAAENLRKHNGCWLRSARGFNEAAARCRGKLTVPGDVGPAGAASMRPRPDAAENDDPPAPAAADDTRFNEAAARCRGKLSSPTRSPARRRSFNEAAARCRGKLWLVAEQAAEGEVASMRPRPDAAENARI